MPTTSYEIPGASNHVWQTSQKRNSEITLPEHTEHTFANPFYIEDLLVFDQQNLDRALVMAQTTPEHLAWALHQAPSRLIQRIGSCLPEEQQPAFSQALAQSLATEDIKQARHILLDSLFWELTYWKTPELYEELIAGEQIHPGIFQQLKPLLQDKIVLDAGAGCGRATFAAHEHGASLVHAVEPSPGLRRIFVDKLAHAPEGNNIVMHEGDFTHIPLPDKSVDLTMACSAFTSEEAQGGEPGLAELKRVTRPNGYIVLIWPRTQDHSWLIRHHFHTVVLPLAKEMSLSFTSWHSAWRCVRRFYASNTNAVRYLHQAQQPRLPFSVLGINAPRDYCWLQVRP